LAQNVEARPLVISIVSHGHGSLVGELLGDIARLGRTDCRIVLTLNIPEDLPFDPTRAGVPVALVRNVEPKGYGANHNAAFKAARGDHFCVLNPDIRLHHDPFPALLALLRDPRTGVAAPLIRSPAGALEDSARRFPTPMRILAKALYGTRGNDYPIADGPVQPDWVAGMFMLLRAETFERVGGFDERYFLYYEDVDLCARLRLFGLTVAQTPAASAVHDARRASHRDLRYLRRHAASMLRFFLSTPFRRLRGPRA
jgi:N-acetylglucosaminyl-diphospho-decaprenol L-rhamnosyltransferase